MVFHGILYDTSKKGTIDASGSATTYLDMSNVDGNISLYAEVTGSTDLVITYKIGFIDPELSDENADGSNRLSNSNWKYVYPDSNDDGSLTWSGGDSTLTDGDNEHVSESIDPTKALKITITNNDSSNAAGIKLYVAYAEDN